MMSTNTLVNLAATVILSAAVVGSQFAKKIDLESQLANSTKEQVELSEKELSTHLTLLQRLPSLGFENIVADSVFIQFLQYFGDDKARKHSGYANSPEFFETLIARDPYYRNFYVFLSGSSTIYAAKPERTVEITEKGLSRLAPNQPSGSYYIWRYKAVDELLFLGDGRAAQKSFEMAANWAAQSDDPAAKNIRDLSKKTAAFLADNPDSRVAQIDAWSSLLTTALDKTTREHAVARIEALGGSVVFSEDGGIQVQHTNVEVSSELNNSPDI